MEGGGSPGGRSVRFAFGVAVDDAGETTATDDESEGGCKIGVQRPQGASREVSRASR